MNWFCKMVYGFTKKREVKLQLEDETPDKIEEVEESQTVRSVKDITIEDLLAAGIRDAYLEHGKNVRDTDKGYAGDVVAIHAYYVEIGWAKILAANGKSKEYSEADKDYWCGAFVASMLMGIGHQLGFPGLDIGLNPKLAYFVLPSTRRLNNPEKWRQAGFEMPKQVPPEEIQAGDIACVTTGEKKEFGDHITLATSSVYPGGTFDTIEGNAKGGTSGDGKSNEGVQTHRRHTRVVRRVYRLERKHFVGVGNE